MTVVSNSLEVRRLLAPLPLPITGWSATKGEELTPGPLYYLSWGGWELYLTRRLALEPERLAQPLLLPDLRGPEEDFAAIDQLVTLSQELGAGILSLPGAAPESQASLEGAIRDYNNMSKGETGPLIDDRSFLALWAVTEYQIRWGEKILAQAAAQERAMWAALKGDDEPADALLPRPTPEPDRRTVYAWECWRRLAGPLLRPTDQIVPNAPEVLDN